MLATRRLLLLSLLAPVAAGATTFVPIADTDLAEQAQVIVQATVAAVEPAPIPGPPSVDNFIQIERVLKGPVAGSTVVVRVPGGIGPDGVGLRIWGAPGFRLNERVLLFLSPRSDGTYSILHLMLGAFREVQLGGRRLAIPGLGEAPALAPWGGEGEPVPLRSFDRFVEWLERRGAGEAPGADYWVALMPSQVPQAAFPSQGLEDRCTQLPFRWSELDRGEEIPWTIDRKGAGARGSGAGELAAAREAWNQALGGRGALVPAAPQAAAGLSRHDGINALRLEDPDDEIAGSFSCSTGGLVAVTGIWFNNGRSQDCRPMRAGDKGRWRGGTFLQIQGADILTNDGASCLLAGDSDVAVRVLAHELGHALGLTHLPSPGALMQGGVEGGGEGAMLGAGDRAAFEGLYGADR